MPPPPPRKGEGAKEEANAGVTWLCCYCLAHVGLGRRSELLYSRCRDLGQPGQGCCARELTSQRRAAREFTGT